MIISLWRFSHLMLAVISSIFIFLAAVTGIVLAVEPISNQIRPYAVNDLSNTSLTAVIENLSEEYEEILSIEIDDNNFVVASVFTQEGTNEIFYVNAKTGEKLGNLIERPSIYQFATNLHRSLFLKSTGRCIVGIISFFLILMTLTGAVLIAKRQGGIKRWFSKVVKEDANQYYHVVLGRYMLIPILIIAFTGVYLSLEKFGLLPEDNISHSFPEEEIEPVFKRPISEFEIFETSNLSQLKSLEFPFSDAIEDYFYLKLTDRELYINQFNGAIVSEHRYPISKKTSYYSLFLHTGRGSILWSIVLGLACLALVYFIYSGFAMFLKRLRHSEKAVNLFKKEEAEFIILVGSETGSTFSFASMLYKALIAKGKKVLISELNQYETYENAKQLIVFTATYGEGEAPNNAKRFETLFKNTVQNNTIEYAVLGFGSLLYPDYCKFAIQVDALLQVRTNFQPKLPLYKINNQSFQAFGDWVKLFGERVNIPLEIKPGSKFKQTHNEIFKVINKSELNPDNTFLLRLRPRKSLKFQSGDLLSIKINDDEAERLYSIGKIDGDILLSIKKHEIGVCSNYLFGLEKSKNFKATIKPNPDFHLLKNNENVVMIANGTGVAPFLGMLDENKSKHQIDLFWGLRTKSSVKIYQDIIDEARSQKKLSSLNIAYSQEKIEKKYVQHLLEDKAEYIASHLKNNGLIMICGSIAMQKEVLKTLNVITTTNLNLPLSEFETNNQLKMDCY